MADSENKQKPFSIGYVLRTTVKHMRRSVDMSLRKTLERSHEFQDNPEKASECFRTLSHLHQIRRQLDEFQEANAKVFKED